MKLLVTGGAGFIGSHFIKYILKKYNDYEIVNLDFLTYAGNLETLKDIETHKNYKFIKGDIADKVFIESLFEKEHFDMVINFAAESHVDRSLTDPGIFAHSNILGTQILIEAARKNKIKRFHQVSTDEVYGDLPLDRKDLFFTESTPLNPSSPYSASKASADMIVLAYYRTFATPVTVSRCSNNYGPHHFPEKLIPLVISRAINDLSIPVYGEGVNVRDWLYVEDHCSAIDKIIHIGKEGEVYNIGGHNERTNIEVVKAILKELCKPESLIEYVKDRAGHDKRYAINPNKIETQLGWKAEYAFEEGLKNTVQWYVCHQKWWQNIISGEYRNYYKRQYKDN